jgi:hypothetical protein
MYGFLEISARIPTYVPLGEIIMQKVAIARAPDKPVIPCKALEAFGFSPVNRGAAAMNAVAMLREKFGDGPITFSVLRSPPTDSEYIENVMFDYIRNNPYPWLLGSHRCIRLRKKKKIVRLPNMFRCSAKKVFSSWVKR